MTQMTYQEALNAGYTEGETRLHRGYISRRIDPMTQPVQVAGGNRRGELFVELPNWESTRYLVRRYLIPPVTE